MTKKTTLQRCIAKGCRTLTPDELCQAHEADRKLRAEIDAHIAADKQRAKYRAEAASMVADIEAQVAAAMKARRERQREELGALRWAGERADRAGEVPVFFSEGSE